MHSLYFFSVYLHILAAIAWVGGMIFLVAVVVPWLRAGGQGGPRFLRETGLRFRSVGWWSFAILLVTGTFNLWFRGVRLASFANPAFLRSEFGHALVAKLAMFAVVLAISAFHDFRVGPRATAALERDPTSPEASRLRKHASLFGRLNFVLALLIVALAVALVRGSP